MYRYGHNTNRHGHTQHITTTYADARTKLLAHMRLYLITAGQRCAHHNGTPHCQDACEHQLAAAILRIKTWGPAGGTTRSGTETYWIHPA